MIRKNIYLLIAIGYLIFCSSRSTAQIKITNGLNSITQSSLIQTTKYLSSNKFKGRLQGTMEYMDVSRYVASKFVEYGLKPIFSDSLLQFFDVEYNDIKHARLALLNDKGYEIKVFKLGDDFVCRGFTGAGNVKAEVVFCGYGIESEDYNDYRSINVREKIVMVFKTNPSWVGKPDKWGDLSPRGKARIAKKQGAKAILFINQPFELSQRILAGSVACGPRPHLEDFPMLQISNMLVDTLIKNLYQPISEIHKVINEKKAPYSVELGTKVALNVKAEYHPNAKSLNVVGFIKGSSRSKKDEYIIIGAHLDHVGMQSEKLIFPGANDNASGVAAILEIAKAIKVSQIELDRSIIFVAFSSEESGLNGSTFFVDNMPVPKEKVRVMLNFDCVADGDSIAIGGKNSFPELWSIAAELDKKHTKLLSKKTFGGGGADAEAFYKIGIPTLYFNTSNGYNHLHLPSDKVETLNPFLFEKLTKLGFLTIVELANGKYYGEMDLLEKK